MRLFRCFFVLSFFLPLGPLALGTVNVTSPTSGAQLGSPVRFAGTASASTCSRGVASMGVYIDDKLEYVVNGTSLDTSLSLSSGSHKTVIEEWDYCGGATYSIMPITVTSQSGVWVTSPSNNATVGSPVKFVATSNTSSCSKGVATMGVYINDSLKYVSKGSSLNTSLSLGAGTYKAVVEEWDYCGGATYSAMKITVPTATADAAAPSGGTAITNLQAKAGWVGYGEFPPSYDICTSCGSGVSYSMKQGITSPSMSGKAAEFKIGGSKPYSDVLWTNALIGSMSTQGLKDSGHTLLPNLHTFTYDVYFYGTNLETAYALEFDTSQYFNGLSLIWGQQCRVEGGHEWDVWDNVTSKWVHTGIACKPKSNAWNHLTIVSQRTSDNQLLFKSITLNGVTNTLNRYNKPGKVSSSWYGVTVNFQTDGDIKQTPYTVYLDNFTFTYQ